MKYEKIVYNCPLCGEEWGLTEQFSHDHENVWDDEMTREEKICPNCVEK